jgi:hypothetical protein
MGLELRRAIAGCHAGAVRLTAVKGPPTREGPPHAGLVA